MSGFVRRFRRLANTLHTSQEGLIAEVVAGGLATLLILTLTGWALISNKSSCAGALDRLDRNTATDSDMQKIQECTKEAARSVQILTAGGSLVGGGGPIPSTGAAGVLTGIIKPIIDDQVVRRSAPAPTKNNPLPAFP